MCGIAGWCVPAVNARSGRGVELGTLRAMARAQAHRGPDGEGVWIAPDARVGLAHRRLSIIDLSPAASQPMEDADGRAVIVFNGEVYNHRDLRRELEAAGARFRTDHSDTETLLVGYLRWGLDGLLERLNGAFAFALVDRERGKLVLVRDRLGIKPLYTAEIDGELLFASEAKALFAHPRLEPQLDRESFGLHLSFRSVPAPRSLFRGVGSLAAGELLELDLELGTRVRRTWWDPLERRADPPPTIEAARERLAELIDDSLRLRLEADVPLGLFLSGGVDSGYLLDRLAARTDGARTWTVTYPGCAALDESGDAARLALAAGSVHTEVSLDARAFADSLVEVAWHQDEPIAAPVCASVYRLARAAREAGVPVVLAGEGSDEIFVGYRNWLRLRDAQRWNDRLPDLPGRPLRRAAAGLAAAAGGLVAPLAPHPELLRRAALGQPLFWSGAMDFAERTKRALAGPALRGALVDPYEAAIRPLRERYLAHAPASDVTGWMSYVDLRFRLPQLMLPRLDKMGMAFSVEGRVPYLDHRLVELALGLPPAWRGEADREGKSLFKSVAARRLPRELVYGAKRGFRAPVAEWKDAAFGARHLPALLDFAERTELLDPRALGRVLRVPGSRLFFGLTNFMLWYLLYVEQVLPSRFPEIETRTRALRGAASPASSGPGMAGEAAAA